MIIYIHNISDLLILHLTELSKIFHLTYSLLLFLFITFSILQAVCFAFCRSFSLKVPILSSPLMPFDRYVHDALFLTFFKLQILPLTNLVYNLLKICFYTLKFLPDGQS